jgi:hypothetical protein
VIPDVGALGSPGGAPTGGIAVPDRSVSCMTGKVETLQFFALQSIFTRPHDPLYRDLLQPFVSQSRFTRRHDPLYRDPL